MGGFFSAFLNLVLFPLAIFCVHFPIYVHISVGKEGIRGRSLVFGCTVP